MGEETLDPTPPPLKMKLASAGEGARIFGVSKQRFNQLAAKPGFPEPIDRIDIGRIWLYDTLTEYNRTRPKRPGPQPAGPPADTP
jgi:hypothetical protein